MSTIRLLFSTTANPFSALIRAVTWSRWSHVSLVDGDTVIEARAFKGVIRTPLGKALSRPNEYCLVDLPCRDPAVVMAAAAGQVGKPYDYLAVLGLGLRRDWQDDDSWFCSELIAWAFDRAGQPLFRADSLRRITPENLWMLSPVSPEPDLVFFSKLPDA